MTERNDIPYGYCHCGCGQRTKLNPVNDRSRGYIKGEPRKYIQGHSGGHGGLKNLTPQERFQRSAPGSGEGCWEWTGTRAATGYGVLYVHGKQVGAHRFAWERANRRSVPAGMHVCHTCDNPICVRPDHLFLGTPVDNAHDMWRKGRNPSGERHGMAKLSDAEVAEMRRVRVEEGLLHRELAERFGVCKGTVEKILSGRSRT